VAGPKNWDRKQVVLRGAAFVFTASGVGLFAAGSSTVLAVCSLLVAVGLFWLAMRDRAAEQDCP
jgi:hypothetical protein